MRQLANNDLAYSIRRRRSRSKIRSERWERFHLTLFTRRVYLGDNANYLNALQLFKPRPQSGGLRDGAVHL